VSTLNRKAWGDLTRHRARTLLTVLTLGLAIASLSFIALPNLMDAAVDRQIQASRLYDVAMNTRDLDLTTAQLDALGHLPDVAAVDSSIVYGTRMTVGSRTQDVEILGLELPDQPVDAVTLLAGRMPRSGEILADAANGRAADLTVTDGESVDVRDGAGTQMPLRVSGTGIDLAWSPGANGSTIAVFYATAGTVRSIAGVSGVNYLAFRLIDNSQSAEASAVTAVRDYLTAVTGQQPFTALPVMNGQGAWPGQSGFQQIISLFYVITVLAFVCALFLIASTMNTLVVEQATEIAILKTLGGRRRQIASIVLRTAALLGAAGAVVGTGLGIVIAYVLTRYFASTIVDVPAGFGIWVPVVVASLVLGPVLAVVASLPGLRRALRRPVAEGLAGGAISGYGSGWLDRLVAHTHLLSSAARMGVRNALRQKRRSAVAIAQVAVAVGLALSVLAVGRSITTFIGQTAAEYHFSIEVDASSGAQGFNARAAAVAAATPGVSQVEQLAESEVAYRGQDYQAFGFGSDSFYAHRLSAGRWFTAADETSAMPPVVLGPATERATHARVGATPTLDTAAGPTAVRVIGIDTGQFDNGDVVYFPLTALERLTGRPGIANTLWLRTASTSHAVIDRTTTAVADRLAANGYPVTTQEIYVETADDAATDTTILTVVEVLGLLVVAISLMGLVGALTMSVIERTREIGVLRCLGARKRHIRRVFGAEGVALAAVGWVFGIPLGWLLSRGMLVFIQHDFGVALPPEFPPEFLPIALIAVIVLTLIVMRPPLRRATRVQPGTALRYQLPGTGWCFTRRSRPSCSVCRRPAPRVRPRGRCRSA
jgi:putative ABC transport system permease protein